MRRPALALLALLACGCGETIGEYRQRIDPELLAACEPRVAKMREAFARIPRKPSYHDAPREEWRPVVHPVGEPLVEEFARTHRLVVHADGGFGYERAKYRLSAIDQILGEDLARKCEHARLGQSVEPVLHLWLDRQAPVAELVQLLGNLPQPLRHDLVVYVPADAAPPPPMTPAIAATQGKSLVEELMAVHDAIGEALGGLWCDPVRAIFVEPTGDIPVTPKVLLDDLPTAILTCRCEGIDVETVTAGYWSLYLYQFLRPRVIPLPLTRDPKADALVVPRDATGTDFIALVAAKGPGPYRLVLAPDPAAPRPAEPAASEPKRGRPKKPRR